MSLANPYIPYSDRLTLIIENNLTEQEKNWIDRYWRFKEEEGDIIFTKVSDLAKEANQKVRDFTKFVQNNSQAEFTLGPCQLCEKVEQKKLKSQTALRELLDPYNNPNKFLAKDICPDCTEEFLRLKAQKAEEEWAKSQTERKNARLKLIEEKKREVAVKLIQLNKINAIDEFNSLPPHYQEILVDIARAASRDNTFHILFNRYEFKDNKEYLWDKLNVLERKKLIYMERLENRVVAFHMNTLLKEKIRDLKIDHYENIEILDEVANELQLKFSPNLSLVLEDEPVATGYLKLDKRIILEKDKKYVCGLWRGVNGDIYLKVKKAEEIESPNDLRVSS